MTPRVVHVIARMNVGGPAELIVQLLHGLDGQSLLTGEVEAGEADHLELRSPDTPFTRVPGLGRSPRPGDDLRALAFLVRELRRRRPDVVHTHTAKAGALGRVAAAMAGVPHVVHTFHGHLLSGYFSPGVTRAVALTERVLARRTSRIVAVGSQVRDDLLGAGIGRAGQYVVIPPGVAMPPPQSRDAARRGLGVDGPVVASVGRLIGIKRPDRLLAVARLLPEVTFLVAGEGPLLAATRDQAPGNVRFLGWRADVGTVWSAADLALLTSDNEGMPVSLIEAAMCGTPAVATDVGSVREVVGDAGEVTGADPGALADAVRRVLGRDIRAATQARAQQRFGVPAMLAAHQHLYDDLGAWLEPLVLRQTHPIERAMAASTPAYRIKITLTGVKPPVWRRVVLPGGWHLGRVHEAVQTAMGWTDSHLHEFEVGGVRWGQPDPDWDDGEVRAETSVRLHKVLPAVGDKLVYSYDFGDDWRHVLLVEELLPPAKTASCLAGRGACPPEDCGGPWGYAELLAILADPTHPEHVERLTWAGGLIDPKAFDPADANEALGSIS